MSSGAARLRVALVAGTLGQGGAEKQLVLTVRALRSMDVQVDVFSLTRGEYFTPALRALGVDPVWIGRYANPAARTLALAAALRRVRPHIVQSAHFYANLYVHLVAPLYGAIGVGTARSDVVHDVANNGRWGRRLLRAPRALIVNSHAAKRNALAYGRAGEHVHVLPNVIDLPAFDADGEAGADRAGAVRAAGDSDVGGITVIGVGSFVSAKRFDRFLHALAEARRLAADGTAAAGSPGAIRGVLIGDGPDRDALEALAGELGLLPDGVRFLGRRNDVPAQLRRAHVHLLTSEHEGFPNALLEAMAAGLPVITTPAGDAEVIVDGGAAGMIVPMDDTHAMAAQLVALARSAARRAELGGAARRRVETHYAATVLPARLAVIYRAIAAELGHRRALAVLPA